MRSNLTIVMQFVYNACKRIVRPFLWLKTKLAPPKTVNFVDVQRYSGLWYEISSIEQSYAQGCVGTTVHFKTMDKKEKIPITLQCYEKSFSGPIKKTEGNAWVVDKKTNAKLKVQFIWPFTSYLWVLDLGDNYEYSAFGTPDRASLWIVSREKTLTDDVYDQVVNRMKEQGYDTSKLKKTKQE